MSMKVIPTAAVLGAEIAGVDLSRPLDDADVRRDRARLRRIRRHLLPRAVDHARPAGRVHAPLRRDRIQHLRRALERAGQPRDRRPVQHHRGRPTDRRPPRRRELAQRHVLHREAAARDDPVRHRDPRATGCRWATPSSPAPPRPGTPCPSDEATPRGTASRVRFPRTQAGPAADARRKSTAIRRYAIRSCGPIRGPVASAST